MLAKSLSLAISRALCCATQSLGNIAPAKIHISKKIVITNFAAEIIVQAKAAHLSCFFFKAIIQNINQSKLNPTNDNTKLVIANHCLGSS
jgi:hypothetical protein